MSNYQAPAIIGESSLSGLLGDFASKPQSDAELKYGVTPLEYKAPSITASSDLDAELTIIQSSD